MIQAEDITWESVCKADHFFKGVEVIGSLEKFIKLIKQDRKLEGIDTTVSEMPAKSRILFAEDGTEKIISIDSTLKKIWTLNNWTIN